MKIGVFDSGVGGKAIAESLQKDFTNDEIIYVHDAAHMPYGSRTTEDIQQLTKAAIQPLLESECDCIVIACNTATAAAIEYLRVTYPEVPFVGLEPMVKPAASLTKSGVIAICATPATLDSERYAKLKQDYATDITVMEPECSNWAQMIEHDEMEEISIQEMVTDMLHADVDVIVLACTHYHWIKDDIIRLAGRDVTVIDPSDAISRQVAIILKG